MAKVHLKVFTADSLCSVPIESLITLFTIKYCNSSVQIVFVKDTKPVGENSFIIDISTFQYEFIEYFQVSKIARCCEFPNLEENDNSCIAGLCATLRQIIQNVLIEQPLHYCKELLGFKESCLLSCSEGSVWTRFCELDIISTVRSIIVENQDSNLPIALARFEYHMSQPVRLHNLCKYTMSKKFIDNKIKQHENTVPEHIFAEGLTLTLADIIIFVCVHMIFNFISKKHVHNIIPLTLKWYENILTNQNILKVLNIFYIKSLDTENFIFNYTLPCIENKSLYKTDPKRYKPRNRIYTRQEDIEYALGLIRKSEMQIQIDECFGQEINLDWESIPYDATPEGGDLPSTRSQRKFQQLESLCKPILKLAKEGNTIVDFCSGGGHLGILLAYLLPNCNLILLENKAKSMKKAKERIKKLLLSNITFYQSNLNYFKGPFDIGTCLHACGVATDLVLQQCIEKNAIFVCCPCCYGSLKDCHSIVYPRSQIFKDIMDQQSYLVLSHAADQTHGINNAKTKQGYECMMLIDTDRKLQAEECGYSVRLNKLIPESCSPKNHLLIGYPRLK
ncbi:PREDICTED: glutathione S-transferase C-terminal domain-containing protein homolog [Ceratosolen solmsi marchali]|uniref:Glutathione S-transferase C-terminal domain-containing protein homolog n=1 Tax=Ceratosolen solmsi marchali TaxID=326594 RepID=A0AAJ7E0G3_9HYME|nr:PREDICTED: glutathione S-transferase C-terminal domain-containing protein homolog [Ceratosolen solmsi marchali]